MKKKDIEEGVDEGREREREIERKHDLQSMGTYTFSLYFRNVFVSLLYA